MQVVFAFILLVYDRKRPEKNRVSQKRKKLSAKRSACTFVGVKLTPAATEAKGRHVSLNILYLSYVFIYQ